MEAIARIAANHLKLLQNSPNSASPKSSDEKIAHIVNLFKTPILLGDFEPEHHEKHLCAVSYQSDLSSAATASATAAPILLPHQLGLASLDTPSALPTTHDSEIDVAGAKLSEKLVVKCVLPVHTRVLAVCFTVC